MTYTIDLGNARTRVVEADSYSEEPAGFITFWSDDLGQVLTIRKDTIVEIRGEAGQPIR